MYSRLFFNIAASQIYSYEKISRSKIFTYFGGMDLWDSTTNNIVENLWLAFQNKGNLTLQTYNIIFDTVSNIE
jgi:hypothetical protein